MPSPLPRQFRWNRFARTVPSSSAFPTLQLGRLLHYIFRGLLSVHSRYDLQTHQVALCDPLHRRLRRLCYLHRRSDCYRVERSSSRAGLIPAVDQRLFTAHCNSDVTTTMPLFRYPCFGPTARMMRSETKYSTKTAADMKPKTIRTGSFT